MTYGPPPVPRKPASYSPSFLSQHEAQYFDYEPQQRQSHLRKAETTAYNDTFYPEYDEYDRDFSLDMYQPQTRSRPSSNGSAYGKPLPAPPSVPPLQMPAVSHASDYAAAFEQYETLSYNRENARLSQSSFHMPHSLSQSSLGSVRPLPKPPGLHTSQSRRSPPRVQKTRGSIDERPSNELGRFPRHSDEQEYGHFARSSGGSSAVSMISDHRAILAAPVLPVPPRIGQAWDYPENATSHQSSDSREKSDVISDASFSTLVNFPEGTYRVYDESGADDYWQSYSRSEAAEHSRHTSQDVTDLSIPAIDPYTYHRDLYQDQYFLREQNADAQNFLMDAAQHDSYQGYERRQRSSSGSSTGSFGILSETKNRLPHPIDHTRQSSELIFSTLDAQARVLPSQKALVRPRGYSQGLPIPDQQRTTLPSMIKSKTMADLSSHRTRSNTASTIFERRSSQANTDGHKVPATSPVPLRKPETSFIDEFEPCERPWARSELFYWGRDNGIDTTTRFLQSYSKLFRHVVPTLSSVVAYKTSYDLLQSYLCGKEITKGDVGSDSLIFTLNQPSQGILPIMSNTGCYSFVCNSNTLGTHCYSARCSRQAPGVKAQRDTYLDADSGDWAQFWKLSKDQEPLLSLDKHEIQRQYQIHEVIHSENEYLGDLKVMRDVFHVTLKPTTTAEHDLSALVFGHISSLLELSEQYLHSVLKNRQSSQGPVIESIGDIFQEWINTARPNYVQYASNLRYADRAIRSQRQRNPRIKEWLQRGEQDPRVKKLDFFSFQGAPTRRMQRYALLLGEVLKKTPQHSHDYQSLDIAIQSIKSVCLECDAQVKLAHDKITLMDLNEKLTWRVPQKDLALTDSSRVIHRRGDLQRKNESSTSWQMRDVILLDNFVLCVKSKDGIQKVLSRPPIPVDYLIVEDFSEVLYKSSSTRILGGTITHAKIPGDTTLRRSTTEQARSNLPDGPPSPGKSSNEDLYPFTIKHAGRTDDKMTFYAESASSRTAWLSAITQARSERWQKVCFREPFEVSLITDQAFGRYAAVTSSNKSIGAPTSAVEHAVSIGSAAAPKPITMSRIQCSTLFRKPDNTEVYLVGTEDGIYTNYYGPWKRLAMLSRVSQIAMLEDFGVLTVLADKILIAYTIDDLLNLDDPKGASMRKPPQKLSGSKDVGFFEVGVLKDRMLVVYKKRENGNSVFKALEPVIGKKQEKKSFFKKGTGTDFFRDFDQFFIPADCYGMQYLRSTICIRCSRGFEIMNLDSKQPLTIPDLSGANTTSLRARIEGARPLGTYRVQEGEFLCCYTECGLFVDKYGSICRPYTLEWEGRPTHAVLVGKYVLAIGREFIEVWNIEKRSLRQVITGRDIRLVPHSSAGTGIDMLDRGVVIAMENPGNGGKQLLLELKLRHPQ